MVLLAASVMAADADKDNVKNAAKKLADSGYSWKSEVENGGGGQGFGANEGKVGKDGTIYVSMSGRNNNTTEVYVKGDKVAIKTQDDWQSLDEVTAAAAANNNGGGGGRRGRGRFNNFKNYKTPAVTAQELLDKVKDLKTSEGVIAGDLTEEGAKTLLTFGGRRGGGNGPEISGAKGSVKFWLKDGALSKVQYHVEGTVSFNGNDRDVDRTTTIEFKNVGSTDVKVPDDAAKKLS
jgi:hypothetical protein